MVSPSISYAKHVLTTNNNGPVRVETNDRPFVVLQSLPDLEKPPQVSEEWHRSNRGAGSHFLQAPDGQKPEQFRAPAAPNTAVAKGMMAQNIPHVAAVLQRRVNTQSFNIDYIGCKKIQWEEGKTFSTKDMYASYENGRTGTRTRAWTNRCSILG